MINSNNNNVLVIRRFQDIIHKKYCKDEWFFEDNIIPNNENWRGFASLQGIFKSNFSTHVLTSSMDFTSFSYIEMIIIQVYECVWIHTKESQLNKY